MSQKIKTSVEIDGSLSASQIANATIDTDKFLVSDGGVIKYRTGAELATDLGIAAGVTSKVQHQVKAGVAINKGQAVYVTGADGTNMIVGLASNATEATSSKTMGLLNATVSANGFADVITEGLLDGLDTSAAVAGNPVWLGTGGNLIYGLANKPYAPSHLVFIGIVTRVNANNGEIFVKVQNGFELDELHDVDLKTTTPINGHLLGFNGTLWVNKTIAGWLGYTPQSQLNGNGFVKASGTTITYDNTSYYPASNPNGYISTYTETDTLASVTGRGASTSTLSTFDGGLNIGNAKLRWGTNTSPTLGFPFTGGPNAFWIDVNDGDTGGLAIDNDGTTIYGAGDSGHVFRVIDEDVYQSTSNVDASTTFRVQQGQNGGGYIRGNFEITGTLSASGYNKTNWDTAFGWGNHASAGYVPSSRTITINGTSYDLSANRSWTVTASETDTLATVTARGNVTSNPIILRTSYPYIQFEDNVTGSVKFAWQQLGVTLGGAGASGGGYFTTYSQDKPFGWTVGSNQGVMTIDTSGNVQALTSSRAPIFYDSNNTDYYLDPDNTSRLYRLQVIGDWAGASPNQGAINIRGQYPSMTFRNTISGNMWLRHMDGAGDVQHYFAPSGADANDWSIKHTMFTNGTFFSSSSMRSPIFYDSNDTSYYLDPNSTSRLLAVNAPSGFTSVGNPWGTANSAFFPNGITTAGSDNWIYGHTYVGNAPANGAGHEFWGSGKEYHRSSEATTSQGASGRWLSIQSANGNFIPYSFESEYGNHSWGTVARFRINQSAADRPSIQFSSASSDNRWNIGYCAADDNFRIVQNMGYRNDNSTSDGWGTERLLINTDGNIYSNGLYQSNASLRAPIFYDSNDTSYYVDPHSTSYQRSLFLGAHDSGSSEFRFGEDSSGWYGDRWYWDSGYNIYRYSRYAGTDALIHYHDTRDTSRITYGRNIVFDDYGKGIVGTYTSTRYQGVFAMGDSYKLPADGSSPSNLYGLAWSHPNAGGVAGNLNTHGLLAMENGTWLASLTGSTRARDDMRAPIFYDNNNTAYYVDAASNSVLNTLTVQGGTNNFNGITYFRTNNGGYLGSTDSAKLQAYSDSNNAAFMSFHKGGHYAVNFGLDADNVMRLGGWSASSNRWQLDMSGNMTVAGDVTAYSDRRVKENIVTVDNALEKVNNLRGVYYTRTDSEDKKTKLGVIAQEILEVVPEVVGQDNDGMYNVSYGNLAGLFIEAIKEQQTQIEELKQLVNKLINK